MIDEAFYVDRRRADSAWTTLDEWLSDGGEHGPWATLEASDQIIPSCLVQLIRELRALRETIEFHGV